MSGCSKVSGWFVLLFYFLTLTSLELEYRHHSSIKTVIRDFLKNIHISNVHTPTSLSCEYHKYHAHNRWKWHKQQNFALFINYVISFSPGSMLLRIMCVYYVLC